MFEKCLLDDKDHLIDELSKLRELFNMTLSEGDYFSWKCVDFDRTETVDDPDFLRILN